MLGQNAHIAHAVAVVFSRSTHSSHRMPIVVHLRCPYDRPLDATRLREVPKPAILLASV
eukprot:COSAG06_NODE_49057_length_328_cov_0.541485_2_plen_59_part_01